MKRHDYDLAEFSELSEERIQEFLRHEDWVVRYHLAKNPNVPSKILAVLAKESHLAVEFQALKRLKNIAVAEGFISESFDGPPEWLILLYED